MNSWGLFHQPSYSAVKDTELAGLMQTIERFDVYRVAMYVESTDSAKCEELQVIGVDEMCGRECPRDAQTNGATKKMAPQVCPRGHCVTWRLPCRPASSSVQSWQVRQPIGSPLETRPPCSIPRKSRSALATDNTVPTARLLSRSPGP